MKSYKNVIWGLLFIVVAVLIFLNSFNIVKVNLLFDGWWTLFIIVPCVISLFTEGVKVSTFIGILVGVLLLLASNDLFSFAVFWKILLPIILVGIGLSIMFDGKFSKEIKNINKTKEGMPYYNASFAGNDINYDNQDFKGCTIDSIFGGVKLNLEGANIKKDVVINATCVFGGIDIKLSKDVNLKVNSVPIFGGVSDERKDKVFSNNNHTIYLNITCIFGGASIK